MAERPAKRVKIFSRRYDKSCRCHFAGFVLSYTVAYFAGAFGEGLIDTLIACKILAAGWLIEAGEPSGIRTPDALIKSQVLYP